MLAEHAAAYVELFADEAATAATHLKRQLSLQLAGTSLLAIGVVLGGIAVMLWASFPTLNSPWALVLTPCVPIAGRRDRTARRVHEYHAQPVRAATTPAECRRGNAETGR